MYESAKGLLRFARETAEALVGTAALRNLFAEAGDIAVRIAFERLSNYLGIGVANLIDTLDVR